MDFPRSRAIMKNRTPMKFHRSHCTAPRKARLTKKRFFLFLSLLAALTVISACYWSPSAEMGSVTFKLLTKGLDGYKARVTFHSDDDDELKHALKIGRKKHFDLDVSDAYGQETAAYILIDDIPSGIWYRAKLQLGLWDYEKDDWVGTDYYVGGSGAFTVIQGEVVSVYIGLKPGALDDDDDDD